MAYEIVMPQLGLTMTEGSITTWLKQPGEWVEKGEILFTVQTDKVEMEVESFGSGYLQRILVDSGKMAPVGTLLATLADEPPGPEAVAPPAEQSSSGAETGASRQRVIASPRARRLARELGLDLALINAAPGDRITEDHVRRYHQTNHAQAPEPEHTIRRAITTRTVTARRMAESFHSAPHFYLGVETNASELVKLREALNQDAARSARPKLTYTDFFLKALAKALAEQPHVNQYWRDGATVSHDSIDVCCAVQVLENLVAPIIRHADRLDLFSTAAQRKELIDKARAGRLSVTDVEGGSATLSNLGNSGVDWFQAILNPPQSVILATGRIATRVVVVGGQIQAQPTVHLNLSVDHRVLDGVSGSAFLMRIQEMIEQPELLL